LTFWLRQSVCRRDLLGLLDRLTPTIAELTQAIEQEAEKRPGAQRLMTNPGVGALTALAFVLIMGERIGFSVTQVASYLGLVPLEESSGNRRRMKHITTRQLTGTVPAGGSGASGGAQHPAMAQ
jgi:transposase